MSLIFNGIGRVIEAGLIVAVTLLIGCTLWYLGKGAAFILATGYGLI